MILQRARSIRDSLARTRNGLFDPVASLLGQNEVDEAFWEELEELLVLADMGIGTATQLIVEVRQEASRRGLRRGQEVQGLLKERMVEALQRGAEWSPLSTDRLLTVILVVGVNGSGKTTSIAKLARYHMERGRKVLLAAADTFRAAAIDQLQIWGERVGAPVIAHQPGADPGAVVFDAIRAARARGAEVLIIDTAGRLHTKYNLMQELKKIRHIAATQVHQAPHQTLLVVDATTGQNALAQARHFQEAIEVNGIILAKLDGTAKGGMAFAIVQELGLPIAFVTTGEGVEDMAEFEAQEFVEGLFEE